MEHFEGIDFLQSIILFWESTQNEIVFTLDAFLLPNSQHYIKPPVDFFPCRRKGLLTFNNFSSVGKIHNISAVKPDLGPHNHQDYGSFSGFTKTGKVFRISGSSVNWNSRVRQPTSLQAKAQREQQENF